MFGHFQVSKKLQELAYINVRCKNMLRRLQKCKRMKQSMQRKNNNRIELKEPFKSESGNHRINK